MAFFIVKDKCENLYNLIGEVEQVRFVCTFSGFSTFVLDGCPLVIRLHSGLNSVGKLRFEATYPRLSRAPLCT